MTGYSTATPMPAGLFNLDDESREKRAARAEELGLEPCTTCGRGVKPGSGILTVVVGGGSHCVHPDEEVDTSDGGYMGAWVLGPECGKKVDARSRKTWEGWSE